jgi:hypothetical protein
MRVSSSTARCLFGIRNGLARTVAAPADIEDIARRVPARVPSEQVDKRKSERMQQIF